MSMNILKNIVKMMVLTTSPEFRKILEDYVKGMYVKALNTQNPFDDYFVEFLAGLLQVDLNKPIDVTDGIDDHYFNSKKVK